MFSVRLYLATYKALSGCAALDFERQYGLDERGSVSATYVANHFTRDWPADEAFARAYFEPTAFNGYAAVPVEFLRPGEVARAGESNDICLAKDISPERAQQLYVAATLAKLRSERDYWKGEAERLQEQPAEEVEQE